MYIHIGSGKLIKVLHVNNRSLLYKNRSKIDVGALLKEAINYHKYLKLVIYIYVNNDINLQYLNALIISYLIFRLFCHICSLLIVLLLLQLFLTVLKPL
jgi:hypothetical protein